MNQLSENFEDPSHPYHETYKEWYKRATISFYSHEDPNRYLEDDAQLESLSSKKEDVHHQASTNPSSSPPSQSLAGCNGSRETNLPSFRSASYPSLSALPANTNLSGPFSRISLSPEKEQKVKQKQSGTKLEEAVGSMRIQ